MKVRILPDAESDLARAADFEALKVHAGYKRQIKIYQ